MSRWGSQTQASARSAARLRPFGPWAPIQIGVRENGAGVTWPLRWKNRPS